MIGYTYGVYDILREADLQRLSELILESKAKGAKCFGLGIYDENLCEHLNLDKPLKSLEDRLNIMSHIKGVDFVFPIKTLDEDACKKIVRKSFLEFSNQSQTAPTTIDKKYELGYVPGTHDLFHAGHLENLLIAFSQCKKLIVGVKSDALVYEHKGCRPIIPQEERARILEYFKFVDSVYIYNSRDLLAAHNFLHDKYGQPIDATYLGSDLKDDFASMASTLNIIFTERPPAQMKKRSTTSLKRMLSLNTTPQKTYKAKPTIKQQLFMMSQQKLLEGGIEH